MAEVAIFYPVVNQFMNRGQYDQHCGVNTIERLLCNFYNDIFVSLFL